MVNHWQIRIKKLRQHILLNKCFCCYVKRNYYILRIQSWVYFKEGDMSLKCIERFLLKKNHTIININDKHYNRILLSRHYFVRNAYKSCVRRYFVSSNIINYIVGRHYEIVRRVLTFFVQTHYGWRMFSKTFSRAIKNGSCYKMEAAAKTIYWCHGAHICIIKSMHIFYKHNIF